MTDIVLDLPNIPVRWKPGEDRIVMHRPEMLGDHPMANYPCLACAQPLGNGEPIVLLALGPANDAEAQEKARNQRWHTALAVCLHAACAGIYTEPT